MRSITSFEQYASSGRLPEGVVKAAVDGTPRIVAHRGTARKWPAAVVIVTVDYWVLAIVCIIVAIALTARSPHATALCRTCKKTHHMSTKSLEKIVGSDNA